MNRILEALRNFGLPRIIIAVFLLALYIISPFVGVNFSMAIQNTITRFAMNGIMVLAMVPMVQSGCGLNFGLPLGVIAGLLGATMSIEFGFNGLVGFLMATVISLVFGAVFGFGYGKLLNRVKGNEMMIATYVGFSSVMLMSIGWLVLPYKSPTMIWGYGGEGLRTTISLEAFWAKILDNFLAVKITGDLSLPVGTILVFLLACLLVWLFFHMKTGTAMTAVGSNPVYARASGVSVDRMRLISVILSTMLGAFGILVYQQSFGFIQLYDGPFSMAFPAVAAILIGGASVHKATITNVIVGTFLFQGILTMTPTVINSLIKADMSEVIRMIISNGMILYALTRKMRVTR